ncbi:MAG: Xaa-Pro peptidase family protein [Spirochaetaceae bacterium]|jgi:Xaa-Pro dipeptidase|nr:Xaa-Pro peptidase family protein [Spirochaetaceae bacterium]
MNYLQRRERIYDWMAEEGISLVLFEDCEKNRDQSVRYLCGQPGDALLLLSVTRKCLLIPWDINIAARFAGADELIPYSKFDLNPYCASRAGASFFRTPYGAKVEIPAETAYPAFLKYVEELTDYDVLCRSDGVRSKVTGMRAIKDEDERALYRLCAQKTNVIIDALEKNVSDGTLKTETDAALFIEAECRKAGCDGVGFTTLAAGSSRSFGIHCFPPFTAGAFARKGLSILDFGIVFEGYTSDVTLTFARSPDRTQKKQLSLIEGAFKLAFDMVCDVFKSGQTPFYARSVALAVDEYFKKQGVFMPHGLGHGIGLEAHEAPFLRRAQSNTCLLEKGMIFTIEPGLYDAQYGGCRLENDILFTETGPEILTTSRIIQL